MTKSTDLRDIVISHYKNGKKASEIVDFLANKVHRATIYRWIDYSIWNGVDRNIDYKKVRTRDDLKQEIKKSCRKIDLNFFEKRWVLFFDEFISSKKIMVN